MQQVIGTVRSHVRLIYAALFVLAAAVVGWANATTGPNTASLPKAVVGYLVIAGIAFAVGLAFFNFIRQMRSPRPKVFAFYLIAVGGGLLMLFAGSLVSTGYSNSSFTFFFVLGLYVPLLMHTNRLGG